MVCNSHPASEWSGGHPFFLSQPPIVVATIVPSVCGVLACGTWSDWNLGIGWRFFHAGGSCSVAFGADVQGHILLGPPVKSQLGLQDLVVLVAFDYFQICANLLII